MGEVQHYPNQWRENLNLSKIKLQVQNKNLFLPEDRVQPNVDNLKFFELLQDLVDTSQISKTLRWVHQITEEQKRVSIRLLFVNF